jgi:hypothetical protein
MFPSERIHKNEGAGELFCLDEEFTAISLPFGFCFIHVCSPLGEAALIFFEFAYIISVAETINSVQTDATTRGVGENQSEVPRIYSHERPWSIPQVWCKAVNRDRE